MKTISLLFAAMAMFIPNLSRCQDAATTDPFASGPPVVTQMPAYSQWTIDYSYSATPSTPSGPPASGAALAPAMVRPLRVVITKTDPIRHEEKDMEQGLRSDLWISGDVFTERTPRNPQVNAYLAGVADKTTDFPQLNWIAKGNFAGIQEQQGHKCLFFRSSVDILEITDPHAFNSGQRAGNREVTADVDFKTRYPVSLQFEGMTLQYTFLAPPTVRLVVPDDFAAAAKAMQTRLKQLELHPALP